MRAKTIGPAILAGLVLLALVGTIASALPERQQEETPTPEPTVEKLETICHKPGTAAEQTMTVPQSAVPGHRGHGDRIGRSCEEEVVVPTPEVATATSIPTATNTPIPPTPTDTPVPPTPTLKPGVPTWTPTATNQPGESVIVTNTPVPTATVTRTWVFDVPDPAPTCDLCSAQEEALRAQARWYNTLADALNALVFEDLVPEIVQFIFGD